MSDERSVVAAFDFDGTITRRDSLVPFLARVCGRDRLARVLARHAASLVGMNAGLADRDVVKERVLADALAGIPLTRAREAAEAHAESLLQPGRLRDVTTARLRWHRDAGHALVLVTASPELYTSIVATSLGFDAALGTQLEVDDAGLLTGRLVGVNCRGPEKVSRLEQWLEGKVCELHAYGDSSGDRELLARADTAFWVRRGRLVPYGASSRSRRA